MRIFFRIKENWNTNLVFVESDSIDFSFRERTRETAGKLNRLVGLKLQARA